jgi:hypothetical protein
VIRNNTIHTIEYFHRNMEFLHKEFATENSTDELLNLIVVNYYEEQTLPEPTDPMTQIKSPG